MKSLVYIIESNKKTTTKKYKNENFKQQSNNRKSKYFQIIFMEFKKTF